MLYDYQNKDGQIITISRSMKSKIPDKITRKGVVYNRVWYTPTVQMEPSKPKTVGSLAEKNTRKMVERGEIPKKKDVQPWWRDSKKPDMDLAKMTPKQKTRYIMEGKK